jgi:hypothetical protein
MEGRKMKYFTQENTEGYTDIQLDALNAELDDRLNGIEPYTDEWYQSQKSFSDEVSRR